MLQLIFNLGSPKRLADHTKVHAQACAHLEAGQAPLRGRNNRCFLKASCFTQHKSSTDLHHTFYLFHVIQKKIRKKTHISNWKPTHDLKRKVLRVRLKDGGFGDQHAALLLNQLLPSFRYTLVPFREDAGNVSISTWIPGRFDLDNWLKREQKIVLIYDFLRNVACIILKFIKSYQISFYLVTTMDLGTVV